MDLTTPQCDGYQATHALRQDPHTSQIIIIAQIALDEAEVRRHRVDFDGYMQKGRSLAQLVALIRLLGS